MASSTPADPRKVYIRLRKNSAGEWRAVPRLQGPYVIGAEPEALRAAENATGSTYAPSASPTNSVSPLQRSLERLSVAAPLGALAYSSPHGGGDFQRSQNLTPTPSKPKSILKRSESVSLSERSPSSTPAFTKSPEKNVRIRSDPDVRFISPLPDSPPDRVTTPPTSEDDLNIINSNSSPVSGNMADGQRQKLKLSLKTGGNGPQGSISTPPSATARTPSIKLSFNKNKPLPTPIVRPDENGNPDSTKKKRKRTQKAIEADTPLSSEDEGALFKKPGPPLRRITFKHQAATPVQAPTPSAGVPAIKLKYKGKLPRRPIGVGYDSENEDTEKDPVILEGFVLRMQPGPDTDYIHKAIADGTVGVSRSSGGADIQIRFFDPHGRRGVVVIRQQKYASSLVDLPCIVEGMKSWDRKGWIKSIDVCQMLLVLGKCNTDEEARSYPLPPDVDPKTYQYAHGLTAPMRWVRERRFNRTKRAKVDDIEMIERRVKALLDADAAADSVTYTVYDHDPREDNEMAEESGEYESESGMEGSEEPEAAGTPADYFAAQNGQRNRTESPQDDVDEDTLAQMFDDDDADDSRLAAPQLDHLRSSLHPSADGSSFAVTSTSGSPSAAAPTPASAGRNDDSGDDDDDDEDEDEDASADEAEEEGDENRQQALDRIEDMNKKIAEQMDVMRATDNAILKKKIAGKITSLKADVEQMRRAAGLESEEDD